MKQEIDKKIDEKAMALSKQGQVIDPKKIKEECERQYFSSLVQFFGDLSQQMVSFFHQIAQDNPEIHRKLMEAGKDAETSMASLASCKTLNDLNKLLPAWNLTEGEFEELYKLGKKWFEDDQFDKALFYFVFLTVNHPDSVENWLLKGMCEQNLGKYQEALSSYSELLQLNPGYALCYLQIMDCLILYGRLPEAKQCYALFMANTNPSDYSQDEFFVSKLKVIEQILSTM